MADPVRAVDGWIELGETPGMGYAIDQEAIQRFRIG
jgi:hypothetical protein